VVALMKRMTTLLVFLMIAPAFLWSQTEQDKFDALIRDGMVYDGAGGDPIQADVGIKGDRIVAIGSWIVIRRSVLWTQAGWPLPPVSSICFRGRLYL
jgi:hypothetical protein